MKATIENGNGLTVAKMCIDGLSSETKPTAAFTDETGYACRCPITGDQFYEVDTTKLYVFGNSTWTLAIQLTE